MSIDLTTRHITATLERAGMLPAPAEVLTQLRAAIGVVGGDADAILELSRASWGNETEGPEDVLVVLMRKAVVLVAMRKRGLLKPPEPSPMTRIFADYRDVAEDDEFAGSSIFFLSGEEDKEFLLMWPNAGERDRMFRAIFSAHAGRYAQWGLQLDPSNYEADFDRYYAQIVAEGPADTSALLEWVEQRFGEFDISNALGFARDWRICELSDLEDREPSARVGRLAFPMPWIEVGESARSLFVRLGERLFDDGLLGPPYDECTFETGEPLSRNDAGPARLLGLMTLAGNAKALLHPRASEWIDAARAEIPAVPPTVFSESMRTLWSDIEELPAVDEGPPAETPIWEDADVRAIATMQGDPPRPVYSMEGLSDADADLLKMFFDADHRLNGMERLDGDSVTRVCLLGVRAFEGLSSAASTAWRKLVLYAVSDLTYDLWEKHEVDEPAAKLAHWVVATIEANHWGPDGRTTPLGQHHSYAMGVAVKTGVGAILIDPDTGLAYAPTGDEARRAAAAGRF